MKIFICTCNDTETAIFCITTDEKKALDAVVANIKENGNGDGESSIHESIVLREYYISSVEDGETFWWREGHGDIGNGLYGPNDLKSLIPDEAV